MKKKAVWSIMLALFFIGITFNVAQSALYPQIRAQINLSRHVFTGVGDLEDPWMNITVINPTKQTVTIESIQADYYAGGDLLYPYFLTPALLPERWNTEVLPFEKSLVFYWGWIVMPGEPEGAYSCSITVNAVVMGEAIELKTRCTFVVLL